MLGINIRMFVRDLLGVPPLFRAFHHMSRTVSTSTGSFTIVGCAVRFEKRRRSFSFAASFAVSFVEAAAGP